MEASYKRSPMDGKQVDYVLSDYSSPAWNVNITLLSSFVPYIKTNGRAFIHSPSGGSTTLHSGGTYFQNPVKMWYDHLGKKKGLTHDIMTIEKTDLRSPLPHYAAP